VQIGKGIILGVLLTLATAASAPAATPAAPAIASLPPQSSIDQGVRTRIKDITKIVGIRENQLIGYGLVVGLDSTGDDQEFTNQSLQNVLQRFNITVPIDDVDPDNVAAVMITTDLPPFAVEGARLDITVSSIGDAKSLQGGMLLLTELKGIDGQTYALAQGPISIGGFVVQGGGGGQKIQKNHTTVGRIPGGAIVEYPVESEFIQDTTVTLALLQADFTTAGNVQDSINEHFGIQGLSRAVDAATVRVNLAGLAHLYENPVKMIAELEKIPVYSDSPARVVINERTGTIVSGHNVRISTVAISHAALNIQIRSQLEVSQPFPLSDGRTVVAPQTEVDVEEQSRPFGILQGEGATVQDLVNAFQAIDGGLTPRDLIAIFMALKEAGALKAELVIM